MGSLYDRWYLSSVQKPITEEAGRDTGYHSKE